MENAKKLNLIEYMLKSFQEFGEESYRETNL